jgi:hypothetical protein
VNADATPFASIGNTLYGFNYGGGANEDTAGGRDAVKHARACCDLYGFSDAESLEFMQQVGGIENKKPRPTRFSTASACEFLARASSSPSSPTPLLEAAPNSCIVLRPRNICASDDCNTLALGSDAFFYRHGGGKRCASDDCNTLALSGYAFCYRHGGGKR